MKRVIVVFLTFVILVSCLVGCNSSLRDSNANAREVLEQIVDYHLADAEFIETILTQVPDVSMLVDYRAACWTYFLVMSDGIEYIVVTDYDGHITSISYWNPVEGVDGETIYIDNGGNE